MLVSICRAAPDVLSIAKLDPINATRAVSTKSPFLSFMITSSFQAASGSIPRSAAKSSEKNYGLSPLKVTVISAV